ncbi:hypothetical protein ABLG96_11205 [Nakamurella sp. A5-74]|uniref:Uncharacterized protein n=1 Tax=Nakamurella sp. A5-74 TaxID=3158264 RepID=A0AAU8DIR5_9ACTN
MEVIITNSARRHGIADVDQLHAYLHAVRVFDLDDDFSMHIGPARTSILLEIDVVCAASGRVVIVHAVIARPKFLRC